MRACAASSCLCKSDDDAPDDDGATVAVWAAGRGADAGADVGVDVDPRCVGFIDTFFGGAFCPLIHSEADNDGTPANASGYKSFWNVSALLRGTWKEMGTTLSFIKR